MKKLTFAIATCFCLILSSSTNAKATGCRSHAINWTR